MTNSGADSRRWFVPDLTVLASLIVALGCVVAFDQFAVETTTQRIDLVFLLDEGRSMSTYVDAIRLDCLQKVSELQGNGVDCRFAVVPFGCTDLHRIPAIPLTADAVEFSKNMQTPSATRKENVLHSGIDAISHALNLPFRKDTTVLFWVISGNPINSGDPVDEVAGGMRERGIKTIIQANASEKDACKKLYQDGGRFYSLEGQDMTGTATAGVSPPEPVLNLLSASSHAATAGNDVTSVVAATGLYAARTRADRNDWIGELGGSTESEQAVRAGLDWLARHQAVDGHWADASQCDERACSSLNYNAPTAQTGLAILAFQAGGHYAFNGHEYSDHVRRGLNWLVDRQNSDGCLFESHTWYSHGIATFALAEACAVARTECRTPNARYEEAARRAVKFMEQHQYSRGGWQYALDSKGLGDTSVTGWQLLALKSAKEAEIDVEQETMYRVLEFFQSVGDSRTGHTGYQSRNRHTDLTTAVGLIVQQFFVAGQDSPLALKAAEYLEGRAQQLGEEGDFYTLYNGTLAMFLTGDDAWSTWNRSVRDAVVGRQESSECQRGSWSGKYSRTLSTAWAVLILEVYYRYDNSQK